MSEFGNDGVADITEQLGVVEAEYVVQRGQKTVLRGRRGSDAVAVKIVDLQGVPTSAEAAVALKRAEREVAFLQAADHPNVVRAVTEMIRVPYEAERPAAVAWCEEWIEGSDLSELLGPQWSWVATSEMARHVSAGLTVFHEHPDCVVHRDLSAGNVRRASDGTYKVMDPGLARFIAGTGITGAFQPGTVGYASPEHVSPTASPIPASDVFCVGILMFQALTGVLPVPVGDRYVENLRNAPVPTVASARPDLEPKQAAVVDTCLQRLAPRRYPSARYLFQALEEL